MISGIILGIVVGQLIHEGNYVLALLATLAFFVGLLEK